MGLNHSIPILSLGDFRGAGGPTALGTFSPPMRPDQGGPRASQPHSKGSPMGTHTGHGDMPCQPRAATPAPWWHITALWHVPQPAGPWGHLLPSRGDRGWQVLPFGIPHRVAWPGQLALPQDTVPHPLGHWVPEATIAHVPSRQGVTLHPALSHTAGASKLKNNEWGGG